MKKFKIILFILLLMVITGCGQQDINLKINEDKSFELGFKVSLEKDVFNEIQQDVTYSGMLIMFDENHLNKYEEKNYFVERSSNDDFETVVVSRKFDNIDDYTNSNNEIVDLFKIISVTEEDALIFDQLQGEKIFSSTNSKTYYGNFQLYLGVFEDENLNEKINDFVVNVVVEFEKKPLSNNADSVSENGKVLTWNAKFGEEKIIEFEFQFESKTTNNTIYFIIGGIVLLIAAGFVFLNNRKTIINSKPEKKTDTEQNESIPM